MHLTKALPQAVELGDQESNYIRQLCLKRDKIAR